MRRLLARLRAWGGRLVSDQPLRDKHDPRGVSMELEWVKSSRSFSNGNCVEVARLAGGGVAVADSKDRGKGPVLLFTEAEWAAFTGGVKAGEFDHLCSGCARDLDIEQHQIGCPQFG